MNDLTFPELRFKEFMDAIRSALADRNPQSARAEYAALVEDCLKEEAMRARGAGAYNRKFAQVYVKEVEKQLGPGGAKLANMKPEDFTKVRLVRTADERKISGIKHVG